MFHLQLISIHALRMERDTNDTVLLYDLEISIHALRMERDGILLNVPPHNLEFQSTRSAWSATIAVGPGGSGHRISIHALRMERDDRGGGHPAAPVISIHALRMERDIYFYS